MERRLDDSDGYISSLQDKIKNLVVEKDLLQGKLNSQLEENTVFKVLACCSVVAMKKDKFCVKIIFIILNGFRG